MLCFFQAEDGIRDLVRSRGLGDVYKRQGYILLCNLALKEWLRDNGQSSEINDAIEEGSGWGLSLIHI